MTATKKTVVRMIVAVALAVALNGCVVVPYGPFRPYHHYYYW